MAEAILIAGNHRGPSAAGNHLITSSHRPEAY